MNPDDNQELSLKYASLNRNLGEKLIRELLLIHNYRVEVYASKKGEPNEFYLAYKGSSGNLVQFENLLFSSSQDTVFSNLLVALQVQNKVSLLKLVEKFNFLKPYKFFRKLVYVASMSVNILFKL